MRVIPVYSLGAMSTPKLPTIQEQLSEQKRQLYSEAVVEVVQKNTHLTFKELEDLLAGDPDSIAVLRRTPLGVLAGESPPATPKNGHTRRAKPGAGKAKEVSASAAGRRSAKNGPKKPKAAGSDPAPVGAVLLADFLKGKDRGDSFKTAEFKTASGFGQQRALNELHRSEAVTKRGEKRASKWVVQ